MCLLLIVALVYTNRLDRSLICGLEIWLNTKHDAIWVNKINQFVYCEGKQNRSNFLRPYKVFCLLFLLLLACLIKHARVLPGLISDWKLVAKDCIIPFM